MKSARNHTFSQISNPWVVGCVDRASKNIVDFSWNVYCTTSSLCLKMGIENLANLCAPDPPCDRSVVALTPSCMKMPVSTRLPPRWEANWANVPTRCRRYCSTELVRTTSCGSGSCSGPTPNCGRSGRSGSCEPATHSRLNRGHMLAV